MAERPATAEIEIRASWTPAGPDAGSHLEAWCDLLCTVAEAVIVAGCLWLLVTRVSRAVRRDRANLAAATGAGLLAALLSVALVDGGPEMVMTAGQIGRAHV